MQSISPIEQSPILSLISVIFLRLFASAAHLVNRGRPTYLLDWRGTADAQKIVRPSSEVK